MTAKQQQQQPFPEALAGAAPPSPSDLWGTEARKRPLPTNSPWLNFVLNNGAVPEYLHPYAIQSAGGKLSVSYPARAPTADFIFQTFVADLSVGCREEGSAPHAVSRYDDLSVRLEFGSRLSVPLVRGSPYVTLLFRDGTPSLSTIHAVLDLSSNADSTRHRLAMNNGQTWLVYASSSLPLDRDLNTGGGRFTGTVRIAVLPTGGQDRASSLLDRYSTCYPVGGTADLSVPFQVKYVWETSGWGDLLMLSLPYHRDILNRDTVTILPLVYASIDGSLQGVVGGTWTLVEEPLSVGWYSSSGVGDGQGRDDVLRALQVDIAALGPILNPSTYFHGKALARAARLALIAEEVAGGSQLVAQVRDFLAGAITPWFNGTFSGNALVYDAKWGGVVSREGTKDPGADFGLAMYNDHHFHHGYFCYAGAVLAKLDPAWGRTYKSHLYALVRDFMNSDAADEFFPRLRCFDPWKLHSWAGGLTEFADGRNQESTSEAIHGYYAGALVGLAYGDPHLINLGLGLAALEIRANRALWHIRSDSTLYEQEFVDKNRVVGVLWANKRDSGLWFAPNEFREMRLGIQLLPICPITEVLFQDKVFVQELVDWALPALNRDGVTDGWRGFVYALLAISDPNRAKVLVSQLKEHDDGNSLSNLLWWIHTRPNV